MASIMVGNGDWLAFFERSWQCASFGMLTNILCQLGCVHTTKNDIFSHLNVEIVGFSAVIVVYVAIKCHCVVPLESSCQYATFGMHIDPNNKLWCVHTMQKLYF